MMVFVGFGQCGLIVVLLKVGKIMLLKEIVNSIMINQFDVELIVFLIDERLEEVMDIECFVVGDVVSLMFDEVLENYIKVVEFVLEWVMCFVEYKKDVIILMDSIICLVCVYNFVILFSGCMFFGGIDLAVFYCLKCFFGVVRNIEEGGSLIILVMVFVDMGFWMDDVIYEEFKGMGNMEFYFDCFFVERWIFLVIDICCLGIWKEELFVLKEYFDCLWVICKLMFDFLDFVEKFMRKMKKMKMNQEFFDLIN